MAITRRTSARRRKDSAGFSLIEVLVSMGILTVVIGGALAGMSNMMTANEMVLQTATMNNSLRTGMDLIIRDLLQVGSGLPSGHNITIPNGAGSIEHDCSRTRRSLVECQHTTHRRPPKGVWTLRPSPPFA